MSKLWYLISMTYYSLPIRGKCGVPHLWKVWYSRITIYYPNTPNHESITSFTKLLYNVLLFSPLSYSEFVEMNKLAKKSTHKIYFNTTYYKMKKVEAMQNIEKYKILEYITIQEWDQSDIIQSRNIRVIQFSPEI